MARGHKNELEFDLVVLKDVLKHLIPYQLCHTRQILKYQQVSIFLPSYCFLSSQVLFVVPEPMSREV